MIAKIEVADIDQLDELGGRLAQHRELHFRVRAREARHDLRQVAIGVIVRHAEPHAAGKGGVRDRIHRLGVQLHDPLRVIQEPLAVLGELRGASVAREDRLSEPFLEPLHLHRDGRLRFVDDFGGAGEASGFHDGDEGFELVAVEKRGHAGHPAIIIETDELN